MYLDQSSLYDLKKKEKMKKWHKKQNEYFIRNLNTLTFEEGSMLPIKIIKNQIKEG